MSRVKTQEWREYMKEDYINVFKALSHRSRLQLLELLSKTDELTVSELAEAIQRQGSTVSRHLKILRLHGLIDVRHDGKNRLCSIDRIELKRIFQDLINDLGIS